MKSKGKTIVNCYDGFYFEDFDEKEVENAVAEVSMELWGQKEIKENEIKEGTSENKPTPESDRTREASKERRRDIRKVSKRRHVRLELADGNVDKNKERA